jgi:hypothetical protein
MQSIPLLPSAKFTIRLANSIVFRFMSGEKYSCLQSDPQFLYNIRYEEKNRETDDS